MSLPREDVLSNFPSCNNPMKFDARGLSPLGCGEWKSPSARLLPHTCTATTTSSYLYFACPNGWISHQGRPEWSLKVHVLYVLPLSVVEETSLTQSHPGGDQEADMASQSLLAMYSRSRGAHLGVPSWHTSDFSIACCHGAVAPSHWRFLVCSYAMLQMYIYD
jgi:hypothetical protein